MNPKLRGETHALFFDVDGTLIDIAPRPDEVLVPVRLIEDLRCLQLAFDGALAVVSGRTIIDIDTLFRPLRLRASGVHGAEVRFEPEGAVSRQTDGQLPADILPEVRRIAARFPGTLVEDKRYSAALHYRQNAAAGPLLRKALDALVATRDDGLKILPGHMVFEVKGANFDKGLAIGQFMAHAPFAGRPPVFLGDDLTDRPGFAEVLRRGGLAFSVGHTFPGTSGHFPNPASVRSWLSDLAASETSHA